MLRVAGIMLLAAAAAAAQTAFEVASVKVHTAPLSRMMDFSSSGPRLRLEGYTTSMLVMEAYDLKRYQVMFVSEAQNDWNTYYDIDAIAPGDSARTRDAFRPMLQKLLEERFQLKVRRDSKEMEVYALVVGKGGPKFHQSAPDAVFHANHGVNGRRQNVVATKFTMEDLADDIGVDRPVVDRTGLTGAYDIKLEATPWFRIERDPQPDDLSMFDAIQDQLGLRLAPEKAAIPILVVEHVAKPTPN